MSDLNKRIASLSPARRALLELKLKDLEDPMSGVQPIPRRGTSGPAPLSFAQQRLWFLDQLEPNSPVYNIHQSFRISGRGLNVKALFQSLESVVRRHESLRTTFSTVDGFPVQIIADEGPLVVPVIDLSGMSKPDRESEILRLVAEDAQRPFDLSRGPLLRAILLRLSEIEHVLLITVHHIVSDGWSFPIFLREVGAIYEANCSNSPSPLSALPIQYADFSVWQRHWLQGPVLEKQLTYWKQQLDGAPSVLQLPTDRPRPAVQSYRGAKKDFMLPGSLTQALKRLGRDEGSTLFMMLLAAFQTLLFRYTSQDDIVVGSPIANRNRVEVEGLIGQFL